MFPTDNLNYTLVMERRGLLRVQTSYTSMEVGPLVPMVDYDIQVNASNTQGYVLSNVVSITMPPGSKIFVVSKLFFTLCSCYRCHVACDFK